MIIEDRFELTF